MKPDRGSLGKGIIKVIRHSYNTWEVSSQIKKKNEIHIIKEKHLFLFLSQYVGKRRYILQETINLQTYHNNPFDIRVSVQKNQTGKWKISGMVGKVARKGSYLSNVYQGGSTTKLKNLFSSDAKMIRKKLSKISLDIAHHLDHYIPLIADVGFDFGIDHNGNPFFIEINFRDQRYSFLNAKMRKTFNLTYDAPVGYGKYLLKR